MIHNRQPTRNEMIDAVTRLVDLYKSLDEKFEVLGKVFDASTGPLFESSFMMFDLASELTGKHYGIPEDEMSWFIYDNECGAEKSKVTTVDSNGDKIEMVIDGVEPFIDFIRLS